MRHYAIRHFYPAFFLTAAGVALSFLTWALVLGLVRGYEADRFEYRSQETVNAISRELHNHEHILLTASGILALSDQVSEREWKSFTESMKLDIPDHSIQGSGFAIWLDSDNLKSRHDMEGFLLPDKPENDSSEKHGLRAPVLFIDPQTEENICSAGHDLYSDPMKKEAMEKAVDSGNPSFSVINCEDESERFMMIAPVYRKNASTITAIERRAALKGFVFSLFQTDSFLKSIFPDGLPFTHIEVFEGTGSDRKPLFTKDSEKRHSSGEVLKGPEKEISVNMVGRSLIFRFTAKPAFISKVERSLPLIVLGAGLLVSAVLSLLVIAEQRSRRRLSELKGSEAHLSATLRSIDEGVIGIDIDGCITVLNLEAERLTGWQQHEVLGQSVMDVFHVTDDTGKTVALPFKNVLSEGVSVPMGKGFCVVSKNGSRSDVEIVLDPIRDDNGKLHGVVFVFRDMEKQKQADLMLENEKKRLANIIEGTNVGTWEWNVQTGEMIFNERWARIKGFELDELAPCTVQTWKDFIHPEDLENVQTMLNDHFSGHVSYYDNEVRVKHKNGSWIWVADRGKVTSWTEDGRPLHMYGTHQDITERKAMEHDLQKVSFAVENSSAAVVIADVNAVIEYVNKKFTKITGYTSEEVVGLNPRILKSGFHPDEFYKEMWSVISAGKEWRGKLYNKKKNDELFWESASISSIKNTQGKVTHYVAIKEDITAQVEMENDLLKTRERLHRTQQIANLGSWELELESNSLLWSDETYRIYGVDPEKRNLSYEYVLNLVHHDDREAVRTGYLSSVKNCEDTFEIEHRVVRKADEKVVWVLEKCSHEKDETSGNIVRSVGMVLDITERKLGEIVLKEARHAAETASRAKSDFLASMNHELRTPLNVVIGFSEVLSERMFGELNDKQAKCVDNILGAGKRLLDLVNDILDLSKIEAGKMDLEFKSVYVKQLLDSVFMLNREKIYKHKLKVETSVSDGLYVQGDERMLKQVMFNLLANAVKFTPDGGTIELKARVVQSMELHFPDDPEWQSLKENGPWLQVSVIDTGIGIRQEDLPRLFRVFEQLDSGSDRQYQGSGLGLSLCRNFVDMHGGKIWAESSGEGKGSRFIFIIPMYHPELNRKENSEKLVS